MTGLLAMLIALAAPVHAQVQHACVAMTVFGEARGEPEHGRRLVAAVIRNRVKSEQWPDSPCEVVLQPRQFQGALAWQDAKQVQIGAVLDAFAAASHPATGECARATYFTRVEEHPPWGKDMRVLCVVGGHKFFAPVPRRHGTAVKPVSGRNNPGSVRRRSPRSGGMHEGLPWRRAHAVLVGASP